ncbi:MAG: DUF4293 domain-containing protein [Paludibacteraceae bacterium]|nr:DUF4293 domain-containing protein [Paludibacteraceae bacterium]
MIQRIQTLYLLLVVILGTLLCIFSPVEFLLPGATDYVSLHALDKWPLAVMSIAIPLLALVTIGMYKRRLLQVRLNIMNVVLCLGYYALLALYVAYIVKGYEPLDAVNCQLSTVNCQLSTLNCQLSTVNCEWYLTMWSAIPLVNVVLTMMATRRILKDEALVRAADRLR